MNCALPCAASTLVMAAVSVVFPWSTCPIVPTFTCGLLRSNFSLAMCAPGVCRVTRGNWSPLPGLNWRPRPYQGRALPTELRGPLFVFPTGAGNGIRTRDIQLGRLTLYQLSYSRVPFTSLHENRAWWRGVDSNHRR